MVCWFVIDHLKIQGNIQFLLEPLGPADNNDKLSKIPTCIKTRNLVGYKLMVHTYTQHDVYFKLRLFQAFPITGVILFVILSCLRQM